jgi:hypothetical protein
MIFPLTFNVQELILLFRIVLRHTHTKDNNIVSHIDPYFSSFLVMQTPYEAPLTLQTPVHQIIYRNLWNCYKPLGGTVIKAGRFKNKHV